jgi:hypothetical protein
VEELERKVQECTTQGKLACTPRIASQDTLRRLEEENKKLRGLLASVGVEQSLVDAHLSAEDGITLSAGNCRKTTYCTQNALIAKQDDLVRFMIIACISILTRSPGS